MAVTTRPLLALTASDLIRWALGEARGGAEDVKPPACPYQVKGRLLTGADAVICTRAQGSCPLQDIRPMTGGRHTAVCLLRNGLVNDVVDEQHRPIGSVSRLDVLAALSRPVGSAAGG